MLPPTPFCAVDRIMSFFIKLNMQKKSPAANVISGQHIPPTALVASGANIFYS
jgi:hypothetical protein